MLSIFLQTSTASIKDFIAALSVGGVGAFFVLIFAVLLIFSWIIKMIIQRSSNEAPIKLILTLSFILLIVFTSMAFYIVARQEPGGKQKNDTPMELQHAGAIPSNDIIEAYFTSINFNFQICNRRAIAHRLTFVPSKPYYILIDTEDTDVETNRLVLVNVDEDKKSATFRIGRGNEFEVKLGGSIEISGGRCKYILRFNKISSKSEYIIFKRNYAHYTLTPAP